MWNSCARPHVAVLSVISTVSAFQKNMEQLCMLGCDQGNDTSSLWKWATTNCVTQVLFSCAQTYTNVSVNIKCLKLWIINAKPRRSKLTLYNSCNHSFWILPTYKVTKRKSSIHTTFLEENQALNMRQLIFGPPEASHTQSTKKLLLSVSKQMATQNSYCTFVLQISNKGTVTVKGIVMCIN